MTNTKDKLVEEFWNKFVPLKKSKYYSDVVYREDVDKVLTEISKNWIEKDKILNKKVKIKCIPCKHIYEFKIKDLIRK